MDDNRKRPFHGHTYVVPGMGDPILPVELSFARKPEPEAEQPKAPPKEIIFVRHGEYDSGPPPAPNGGEKSRWVKQRLEDELEARRLFGEPVDIFFGAEGDEDEAMKRHLIVDRIKLDAEAYAGYSRDFKEPFPKLDWFSERPHDRGKVIEKPLIETRTTAAEAHRAFQDGLFRALHYPSGARDGKKAVSHGDLNLSSAGMTLPEMRHQVIDDAAPKPVRYSPIQFIHPPIVVFRAERICEKCEGKGSYLLLSPFPHTCDVCHGKGKVT